MLLTKTQAKVLQIFTGQITELFTIREIARKLKMHPSLAHRAIKPLVNEKILKRNKQNYLSLDYKKNHDILAYAEYLRRNELLSKGRYNSIELFAKDVLERIKEDSFVLILFGSALENKKPRDIDMLLIVDSIDKVEFHEKFLYNIASGYPSLPFEERVISFESAFEMLSKRDETNLINEILNKHIILYGAELFYRLVEKGR